ncbi:hypothetical protein QWZ04_19105 [Vibrio tapetis subsp. quintayensis]|uniref:hypothetical protein n=1 Tax=Vibrio tapetis TaxID=52443 RepID=UPI0025B3D1B2|nr:hypothetical protein [Vibrio tapetis]MDN3682417.1 hypothetical protein [Vibrio tapetis subsp. quintayensis]
MLPNSLYHHLYRYVTPLLTSNDEPTQCLAIRSLRFFNHQVDDEVGALLATNLNSASLAVVLSSLEALKHQPECDLTPVLRLLNRYEDLDSDIKIAALNVIREQNLHLPAHLAALDVLVDHVCDDNEDWDGEWDDSIDVALTAASILTPHATLLSTVQLERLWARFENDPEPDLQALLIRILIATSCNRVEALIYDHSSKLKPNRLTRKILKSSQNKVLLYQVLRSSDLSLHEVALSRLANLDAKEYLQDFLCLLSSSNVQLQDIAATTLLRWQYPISAQYISPLLSINDVSQSSTSRACLQTLLPILKQDTLDLLINQWQQGSLRSDYIGVLLSCAARFKFDLNSVLPLYYQAFPALNTEQQIDTLSLLTTSIGVTISAAFIRQTIESRRCDNATKLLLIAYLWQQDQSEHQAYAKQLMFTDSASLIQVPPALSITKKSQVVTVTNRESTAVTSTLMSLSAPLVEFSSAASSSKPAPPTKRARKIARIDSISNQAIAVRYCNNPQVLRDFCHSTQLENSPDHMILELCRACISNDICFQEMKTDELHLRIINMIVNAEDGADLRLMQWLEWRDLHPSLEQLQHAESHLTLANLTSVANDLPLLISLLKHPYIGIKQAAATRIIHICDTDSSDYYTITSAILDDIELYPLLHKLQSETITNALSSLFKSDSKKALLSLGYLSANRVNLASA